MPNWKISTRFNVVFDRHRNLLFIVKYNLIINRLSVDHLMKEILLEFNKKKISFLYSFVCCGFVFEWENSGENHFRCNQGIV